MTPGFIDRYYFISLDDLKAALGVEGDRITDVKISSSGCIQLKTQAHT